MGSESPAPGYRPTDASRTGPHAWVFDGVADEHEVIGEQGVLMGGAAGHEVDCADLDGAPTAGVTVLARSGLAVRPG